MEKIVLLVRNEGMDVHIGESGFVELFVDAFEMEGCVDGVPRPGMGEAEVEEVDGAQAAAGAAHGNPGGGELAQGFPRVSAQVRVRNR